VSLAFKTPGSILVRTASMRKLINSTYMTLDGVVENPHLWPGLPAGAAEEHDEIQTRLIEACDIVTMGRRTYDVFAPAWSARGGDPYSDRINTMRKVVASTTLTDPTWNNTEVVADDLVGRIDALKAQDGGDIVQYGFGAVSEQLVDAGLLDEIHLWIYPQFVRAAAGDVLLRPDLTATFDLDETQTLSNDIVVLRYSIHRRS
jgi:dihydrofolate reductase